MKARFGVALFGVGVLLLVLAAGLAFFVAPSVTKLPYDLVACGEGETGECLTPSVAQADGATFLQTKAEGGQLEIAVHTGTLTATTEVDPQADRTAEELSGDLAGEAVVWEVFGTVKRDNGEVINQYIADLAIDRVSAEAREWDKQALEDQGREGPTTVEFEGQTYKFPFHTQKRDYQYFDRDLRAALPIRYVGTEDVGGVEAYMFEQKIAEQQLPLDQGRMSALLERLIPGATSAQLMYSNTRTIWVEPVSGNFVKVREQQRKDLVPDTGQPTALLDADFVYTDDTIATSVARAEDIRGQLRLVGTTGPIVLAAAGALALILGLLLVFRAAERRSRHRMDEATAPAAESVPEEEPEPATAGAEPGRRDGPITDTLPPPDTDWAKRSRPGGKAD